ncbi:MAG: transposase [Acidimicrobiia bacterium]|nr:transposase [Acidimicrobiia bacterium]
MDAASEPGQIGEILRREGLYSQIISVWRRQRDEGAFEALSKRKRGPKGVDPLVAENQQQAARIAELEAEVATLRDLTVAQGKVSALLQDLSHKSAAPKSNG